MAKKEVKPETMSKLDSFYDALGNRSESTKMGYRAMIWAFVSFIYPKAVKEQCAEYVDQYFSTDRDHFADVKKYLQSQKDKAPGSQKQAFIQITKFFDLCDFGFTSRKKALLRNQIPKDCKPISDEHVPTKKEVKAILLHCDVKMKAILLCLSSGGMRIGELLSIRCSDIDLNRIPAKITIQSQIDGKRTVKVGGRHITFISYEAVAAVREWIKIRPSYLEAASKMGKNFKTRNISVDVNDQRLFPVSYSSVTDDLKKAVGAGIDGGNKVCSETGRSLIHNHGFRKFFEGRFQNTQDNGLAIAQLLDGHASEIAKTYAGMSDEDLGKLYLKGEYALLVETSDEYVETQAELSKETTIINAKLEETDAANRRLKDDMDYLRTSKDKLRDRLDDVEKENQTIKNWWTTEGSQMSERMKQMEKTIDELSLALGKKVTQNFIENQPSTPE